MSGWQELAVIAGAVLLTAGAWVGGLIKGWNEACLEVNPCEVREVTTRGWAAWALPTLVGASAILWAVTR